MISCRHTATRLAQAFCDSITLVKQVSGESNGTVLDALQVLRLLDLTLLEPPEGLGRHRREEERLHLEF